MKIIVLGAAAGGGVPQWNCGCQNCQDARSGKIPPLTQSSIAVSGDADHWVILNASPDIRQQLSATPALHPKSLRGTPIHSVLVTNGDIDHIAGLLILREKTPFTLLATPEIARALDANPMMRVLDPELVSRQPIELGGTLDFPGRLEIEPFSVPGKVPLYQEGETVDTEEIGETSIGLRLSCNGKTAFYIPGCAAMPDDLLRRIDGADVLLFDGTVWENDEMPRLGTGVKTGKRMGHMPIAGAQGSLGRLASLDDTRKVYVHINNTNPILQPGSGERRAVIEAGWEVGLDGMEIAL